MEHLSLTAENLLKLNSNLYLVSMPAGTKGPKATRWNMMRSADNKNGYTNNPYDFADATNMNIGLYHEASHTLAFDIDDLNKTITLFSDVVGVAIDEWLANPTNLQIKSPKKNRAKLLFKLPEDVSGKLRQYKIQDDVIFELRCGNCQDVIIGSHPEGGNYSIHGNFADIPIAPDELLNMLNNWDNWKKTFNIALGIDTPELHTEMEGRQSHDNYAYERDPISEFNATYTIHEVLSRNGYSKINAKRYLRPNSSSGEAGVVVLLDKSSNVEVIFSHGGDELCDGFKHDSFDIYRILECGGDWKKAMQWNDEITAHNQKLWTQGINVLTNDNCDDQTGWCIDVPKLPTTSLAIGDKNLNWEDALAAHVAKFNTMFAEVIVGGKHRIMRFVPGNVNHNQRNTYEFLSRNDLSLIYDNTSIKIGEKEVHGKLKDITSNHIIAWAKHKNCMKYTGGIVFLPGRNVPGNYFNTWQGFSVSASENHELLISVYYHIKNIVCAGHDDLYQYFLNWCAYTFQNPDKPAGTALVLRGSKGAGKGMAGHFLKNIWGNHGLHISNTKHLVGQFNGHLNDVCFLFADEAFYSGDRQHEGVLKALITEPQLIIERKGIDAISQPNYLKVLMATNSDFAVPTSKDERRYCVFDVSDSRKDDYEYFDNLSKALKDKDVQAAFLFDMLHRNIAGWHTGEIPDSVGLREQRYHSMTTYQMWVVDSLVLGTFGVSGDSGMYNNWDEELKTEDLYRSYLKWCDDAKAGEFKRSKLCTVSGYLGKVFEKVRLGNKQARGVKFGNLQDAIAKFEQYEKISLTELVSDWTVNKVI